MHRAGRRLRSDALRAVGSWLRRCCSSSPPTIPATLEELRVRQLSLDLQNRLRTCGRDIISKQEFLRESGEVGLTRQEASLLLEQLVDSGGVHLQDTAVHLSPLKVYGKINEFYGLPELDPAPELTAEVRELRDELQELEAAKDRADGEVAARRLRFWAVVSAGSAIQMCTFAFLTFPPLSGDLCLGWDVIEPISFFVMQGYVVGWFAYFFRYKREHSLTAWDENTMMSMSKQAYERRSVDIERWVELRRRLAELEGKKAEYRLRIV